jgi:RPE1 domain-containing protein
MISIISPAKSLDWKSAVTLSIATEPLFTEQTTKLVEIIQQLSVSQLQQLMNVSDKIAELNYRRFSDFADLPVKQAIFAYDGDLYKKIDKSAIRAAQADFLQQHILIISGLYGALRPLDYIKPYRLEMSQQLPSTNLYDFWKTTITKHVNLSLKQHQTPYLINLSSMEYANVIDKNLLIYPMINIYFKEERNRPLSKLASERGFEGDTELRSAAHFRVREDSSTGSTYKSSAEVEFQERSNGKLRIIGLNAKKARGSMLDFIIKNSIDMPEVLKTFVGDGYQFNAHVSSECDWVFTKK